MIPEIPNIPYADWGNILNHIDVGIVVDDAEGNILWANEPYTRITGIDIQKYVGKTAWDFKNDSDALYINLTESLFESAVKAGHPVYHVLKYKTSDRIITSTTPVFSSDGALKYVVCTVISFNNVSTTQQALASAYAKIDTLESQLQQLQHAVEDIDSGIIVQNVEMQKLYAMAFRLAHSPIPIMLLGETGVGKDVLAKYVHKVSDRKDAPFIHVNMGAIPSSLFESELFGYEAGAFTGASKTGSAGLIRLANGGTLFLDEVGEMPLNVQTKLLQVIQEKTVRSVGGLTETPINVKIISATNRNLETLVKKGEFRLDLYYRLNVAELRIPPLRERKDDIPLLIQSFLGQYNERYGSKKVLTQETLSLLLQYDWPGNIRELRHTIESIVVISPGSAIEPQSLPPEIRHPGYFNKDVALRHNSLKDTLDNLERQLIQAAISENPTLAAAAASLSIDASTLAKKRKKYGI